MPVIYQLYATFIPGICQILDYNSYRKIRNFLDQFELLMSFCFSGLMKFLFLFFKKKERLSSRPSNTLNVLLIVNFQVIIGGIIAGDLIY